MRKVKIIWDSPRLLGAVLVAGMASACSSDVARFGDSPFSNPFQSRSSALDPASTHSVGRNRPAGAGALTPVPAANATTQPLPPPNQPLAAAPVGAAGHTGAIARSGSVASANYPALTPSVTGSTNGWTAVGGTPVVMQPGESIPVLSSRYGVPVSVIMAVNGLSGANQAQPGQQLIIPAYNAVNAKGGLTGAGAATTMPATMPAGAQSVIQRAKIPAVTSVPKATAASAPVLAQAAPVRIAKAELSKAPEKIVPSAQPVTPARQVSSVRNVAPQALTEAEKRAAAKISEAKKGETVRKITPAKPVKTDDDEMPTASLPAKKPVEVAAKPVAPSKVEARPEPAKPAIEQPEASADASESSFRWPAKGRIISGFGARGTGGANDGINIAMPEGTPVKAAEGGTVVHADDALKGYGKLVLIRHPNGYVSVYAHNGELNVKRGESVKRGQVIAKSGQSGNVTAPQLHFEIRKGATPVDPTKLLAGN